MNLKHSLNIALATQQMTQSDLAEAMDVSAGYITKIKTDPKTSVGTIQKVCNVLGLKVSDFIKLGE